MVPPDNQTVINDLLRRFLMSFFLFFQEKLFPMISLYWKQYQKKMFDCLKLTGEKLVMSGDGRHDSMGHSAKFGAYTLFCNNLLKIIHFTLVQVWSKFLVLNTIYNILSCWIWQVCQNFTKIVEYFKEWRFVDTALLITYQQFWLNFSESDMWCIYHVASNWTLKIIIKWAIEIIDYISFFCSAMRQEAALPWSISDFKDPWPTWLNVESKFPHSFVIGIPRLRNTWGKSWKK